MTPAGARCVVPPSSGVHYISRVTTADDPLCPNCGAAAARLYCPECGQAQHESPRSVRALLGELLDAFAGWDHKIPATLRMLMVRPGGLTEEYLAGRRVRYLPPLRLYLLASVCLLVALRFQFPWAGEVVRVRNDTRGTLPASKPGQVVTHIEVLIAESRFGLAAEELPDPAPGDHSVWAQLRRGANVRWHELRTLPPAVASATLRTAFLSSLGTTLLLLVPAFALVCGLLWRRTLLGYVDHLVFALHTLALVTVAGAVARITPGGLAFIPAGWAVVYLWRAARRVYGRRREHALVTAAKTAAATLMYLAGVLVGLVGTLAAAVLTQA